MFLAALMARPALSQFVPPTFILESSNNGVYDYSLAGPLNSAANILTGQTMVLDGLSGVTGASVTGALENTFCGDFGLSLSGFTATSVTLVDSGSSCFYGPGGTSANLEIDSSVTTLGTVNFTIQHPGGSFTGTVQGPVESAPEPTSSFLVIIGLVALCMHRRLRPAQ